MQQQVQNLADFRYNSDETVAAMRPAIMFRLRTQMSNHTVVQQELIRRGEAIVRRKSRLGGRWASGHSLRDLQQAKAEHGASLPAGKRDPPIPAPSGSHGATGRI